MRFLSFRLKLFYLSTHIQKFVFNRRIRTNLVRIVTVESGYAVKSKECCCLGK